MYNLANVTKKAPPGYSLLLGTIIALLAILALPLSSIAGGPEHIHGSTPLQPSQQLTDRPNIIIILTDDQRWDTMQYMPELSNTLVKEGVVFNNAFVSTPLCCPSRVSFLSGGYYSHETKVTTNTLPFGGAKRFQTLNGDARTVATALQQSGYYTALVGKYLNEYLSWARTTPQNIPYGYSYFGGTERDLSWNQWTLVEGNSTSTQRGTGTVRIINQYSTDFFRDKALELIEQSSPKKPLFLMIDTVAPHPPAIPDDKYRDRFTDFGPGGTNPYRGRAWGEQPNFDLSDKPFFIRASINDWWNGDASFYDSGDFLQGSKTPDDFIMHSLQTLLSVDDLVKAVVEKVKAKIPHNTIIVFASDNGFLWGEHIQYKKEQAYEESIRVPLVVWKEGTAPRFIDELVYANMDLATTVLDYAGLSPFPGSHGRSLRPFVETGVQPSWRDTLFVEGYSGNNELNTPTTIPDWGTLFSKNLKCVQYSTMEEELYDLWNDPFELESMANDPEYVEQRKACMAELTQYRGLSIATPLSVFPEQTSTLPVARIGVPYSFQFKPWGGKAPYFWSIVSSNLPQGFSINPHSGILSGTPNGSAGKFNFSVNIIDSSTVLDRPQEYRKKFALRILP